jgi:hypothetical protein
MTGHPMMNAGLLGDPSNLAASLLMGGVMAGNGLMLPTTT